MEVKSGTYGYIAPEIENVCINLSITYNVQKCWVGTEIDMFSFGVCLYEMSVAYKPT